MTMISSASLPSAVVPSSVLARIGAALGAMLASMSRSGQMLADRHAFCVMNDLPEAEISALGHQPMHVAARCRAMNGAGGSFIV